jgi:hypothetical protein
MHIFLAGLSNARKSVCNWAAVYIACTASQLHDYRAS